MALTVVAPLLVIGCTSGAAPRPDAVTGENRAIMLEFTGLAYGQKSVRIAYEKFVAADLMQHSPAFPDGREGTIEALQKFYDANPQARFVVKRVIVDGDLAAVHYAGQLVPGSSGAAVVEIFRLENGKIVEHWDVFQGIPAMTRSGRPVI